MMAAFTQSPQHTIESHLATVATGAELDVLVGGGVTALHAHAAPTVAGTLVVAGTLADATGWAPIPNPASTLVTVDVDTGIANLSAIVDVMVEAQISGLGAVHTWTVRPEVETVLRGGSFGTYYSDLSNSARWVGAVTAGADGKILLGIQVGSTLAMGQVDKVQITYLIFRA